MILFFIFSLIMQMKNIKKAIKARIFMGEKNDKRDVRARWMKSNFLRPRSFLLVSHIKVIISVCFQGYTRVDRTFLCCSKHFRSSWEYSLVHNLE